MYDIIASQMWAKDIKKKKTNFKLHTNKWKHCE